MRSRVLAFSVGLMMLLPRFAAADCGSSQANGVAAVNGDTCPNGTDLPTKFGVILNTLFIVAGAVAVLIMIVGGIRYITSTGDSKRIQAAKDTILYAVLGLIIIILARAIVGYVITQVSS